MKSFVPSPANQWKWSLKVTTGYLEEDSWRWLAVLWMLSKMLLMVSFEFCIELINAYRTCALRRLGPQFNPVTNSCFSAPIPGSSACSPTSLAASEGTTSSTGQSSAICICGIPKVGSRIIGGVETKVNVYPWMVSTFSIQSSKYILCDFDRIEHFCYTFFSKSQKIANFCRWVWCLQGVRLHTVEAPSWQSGTFSLQPTAHTRLTPRLSRNPHQSRFFFASVYLTWNLEGYFFWWHLYSRFWLASTTLWTP